jgi:SOS-response transcriptional repressor LexA
MTGRQNQLLAFVALYMREHQRTPSHGTIAKGMACSKQNVTKILQALEKKGVLTIDRTGHRQSGFTINLKGESNVENPGSQVSLHPGSLDGHTQDVCQGAPGNGSQETGAPAVRPGCDTVPATE